MSQERGSETIVVNRLKRTSTDMTAAALSEKGITAFGSFVSSEGRRRLEAFVMPSDGTYVAGFQRAADMIVTTAESDDRNADDLFFPVAYLYRHHLELMLKELVRLGTRLGALSGCESILGRHNLRELWNKVKQLIEETGLHSSNVELKAVEHTLLEFDRLDPTGQAFRYALDKNGRPHLQNAPAVVDLNNLKSAVDAASLFLDAAYACIENCDPGLS